MVALEILNGHGLSDIDIGEAFEAGFLLFVADSDDQDGNSEEKATKASQYKVKQIVLLSWCRGVRCHKRMLCRLVLKVCLLELLVGMSCRLHLIVSCGGRVGLSVRWCSSVGWLSVGWLSMGGILTS